MMRLVRLKPKKWHFCGKMNNTVFPINRLLSILFISAVVLTFSSCKKEVTKNIDQDKIWASFALSYDQNTDKTIATAKFRFNTGKGTLLELSDPSTVMLDGTEIDWLADSAFYQMELTGFVPSGEFTWVDLNGNMFANTVEIHDVDFPAVLDTLHYSDSVTYFMWAGGLPLDSFEAVKLTLDGTGNTDRRDFSVDSLLATTITIDSLDLSKIKIDTTQHLIDAILVKRYSPEMQEATSVGGERVGKYRPTDTKMLLFE